MIYETHLHTSQASACGKSRGRDHIQRYIDAGYSGIIVTDHFYRGNCVIDRSLPWKDFIHRFCAGYEDARNEGEKRGFPVFFGWEENFDGDEYLVYGLDEEWLLNHPEMITWSRKQQYEAVHSAGGCVVQAHPFRARSYNHTIYLSPSFCDAAEIYNSGNEPRWNALAGKYAEKLGLPVTAGSDNHGSTATDDLAGVVFDKPWKSIADYVTAIRSREKFDLHIPGIDEPDEDITPDLPCKLVDEHGVVRPVTTPLW